MAETIDWPPRRQRRRPVGLIVLALIALLFISGGTALSYYVEALWFGSLGFSAVFWTTLNYEAVVFGVFTLLTFAVLYGAFVSLKPARLSDFMGGPILINGQPIRLPVEPVLRLIAAGGALFIAVVTGFGMMADWRTFALYRHAPAPAATPVDPIFGRPLTFYLFTLPVWQLVSGWLLVLAILACLVAAFFLVVGGGTWIAVGRRRDADAPSWRGMSITFAALLLVLAVRVYLGRFERLFDDHTIFTGVGYTDAHVTITGMLVVAGALAFGAAIAAVNAVAAPKLRWLVASVVPAVLVYTVVGVLGWYVNSFIVRPNQLVRERPYIANNIQMTRAAYALDRIERHDFPAEGGIAAVDLAGNRDTIDNIRLWDWRALQDTLRQIQEIRTYYDFPDVDIDRYRVDGATRQMMLAARELSIDKLPESSRNWINEKLIYTHGYGITMNPVNGFTSEGLPTLILSNMPVESTLPSIQVTRPEIYFGELTNTDVYVNTRQNEFNYPQGETNAFASYEGQGGIVLGGFLRRSIIALERGDLSRVPFSDDITAESRLLMRRNVRDRVQAIAPFLVFDGDPYIVIGEGGRLFWMMDAYTTSDRFPYSRPYRLGNMRLNYMRNSVKAVVDAYDGSVRFYVFDPEDPVIGAYRNLFPTLFTDAADMPDGLRAHVRYPELFLQMQAAVYGLYHMTDPEVFYNREDLWTVAAEVGLTANSQQATQVMEPNFVLMRLPGESSLEFIEILPFTPANRNNLIGWIAGRSDGDHYGKSVVYDFPKTRLVDGPLQIEARIDQNAQLSGQLSLWNQQGSHVRRGTLIVIPIGRALLYAEPIYLQAERSPMPQLRIVVLALQDKLAYGATFEQALAALFENAPSTLTEPTQTVPEENAGVETAPAAVPPPSGQTTGDVNALIAGAAADLDAYQRLTAEGRLGEAGQRLESLKQKLEQLQNR
jgi:uncharacterized membrane protein (UPF0182 family)